MKGRGADKNVRLNKKKVRELLAGLPQKVVTEGRGDQTGMAGVRNPNRK